MKKVLLYGLNDADKVYAPVGYWIMNETDVNVDTLSDALDRLADRGAVYVYMINDRPGLLREWVEDYRGDMACRVEFKDMLEREGILVGKKVKTC